jgi:gliding-associated putative ABC transporter substrate-binding component GldG
MKKKSYFGTLLLLTIIIVVINIISEKWFFRIDLTEDHQYSLSRVTENVLKGLDETVTVTAYFTKDLPPNLQKVKQDFKDLLIEYNKRSGGKVAYKFVNPNDEPQTEQEAIKAGIRPVLLNAREKDQLKQQKIYMGAQVMLGAKSEAMPFISGEESMEYALTSAIKKLSVKNKPLLGFIAGNGEPGIDQMPQAMEALKVLYKVVPVTITDTTRLKNYKALVWVAPKDSISPVVFNRLNSYLAGGGNLIIAANRVQANLQTLQGTALNTGLETWLAEKGITVEPDFVVDQRCGTIGVSQRQGMFNFTTQMRFPYMPVIVNFADHPVTKGLEEVLMQFPSPIGFSGDSSIRFTPLAFTSEKSGKEKAPIFIQVQKQWSAADFNDGHIPVAALFSGKLAGDAMSRIIIITTGDLAINGSGRNARKLNDDNVNLFVNSIDYLADDTGLISLRTKLIKSRPLDNISEGKALFLKWLNFLLPVLLIIIYGLFRAQYRKNQRIKRMEEDYVQ